MTSTASEREGFIRRHVAALQTELMGLRAVLIEIEDGPFQHLDEGRFRRDVLESITAYARSADMWQRKSGDRV